MKKEKLETEIYIDDIQYFYENYCRREGMPEYSEEAWRNYLEECTQQRNYIRVKMYRNPLTPEECFKNEK